MNTFQNSLKLTLNAISKIKVNSAICNLLFSFSTQFCVIRKLKKRLMLYKLVGMVHFYVCNIDTKKPQIFQANVKCLINPDNHPVTTNGVAFFAYLSRDEPNPGTHKTFVFDVDHTNIGGHYSHQSYRCIYLSQPWRLCLFLEHIL